MEKISLFDYLLGIVHDSTVIPRDEALGRSFIAASLCNHVILIRGSYARQQLCAAVY